MVTMSIHLAEESLEGASGSELRQLLSSVAAAGDSNATVAVVMGDTAGDVPALADCDEVRRLPLSIPATYEANKGGADVLDASGSSKLGVGKSEAVDSIVNAPEARDATVSLFGIKSPFSGSPLPSFRFPPSRSPFTVPPDSLPHFVAHNAFRLPPFARSALPPLHRFPASPLHRFPASPLHRFPPPRCPFPRSPFFPLPVSPALPSPPPSPRPLPRLNAVSAQQARERRKQYLLELEGRVSQLDQRNAELKETLSTLQRENFMLRQVARNTAQAADAPPSH
ncbi:unnamed protein product [Closterium sp. Naga37s-1]|nr:unnamed protein product [Closterium sp. Naga37s-1]